MNIPRFQTQAIIHSFGTQSPLYRYGLALMTVVIAALATHTIPVIGQRAGFLLFFFAIIQTTFWLGLNPGILAMILSLIAVNTLVLFPASIGTYDILILNAGFCVLSALMIATTCFHRRLTAALWESRQRYAGIVESAMDAMITIGADQRILLFNSAAEKMFGCSADEAIGDSIGRFIPERFRPALGEHIKTFAINGITSRKMGGLGAISGLRANGEEFPIEASLSQCQIDGEKSFTAILRDVSERVHLDNEIKERLKLLDQLAKVAATVPGVICAFRLRPDGSACMPYASPVFESVYGLSPDAVAEDFSPVFARIHPDDIGHIHETIAESSRTLQPWRDSFRYNHPAKGEIWIEGHSMPLYETDGSILWHGYIQDVTERKLSETALRERENELRLIMDATPALISYLDTDFRYLRVNKTYENWFCIPQERILGQDAREVLGAKAWTIIRPYLDRARMGERVNFDQLIPYETGKPRWVHASYIPDRDSTGTVKGIVVHIFDIDEQKRTEEALRESQKENKLLAELIRVSSQPIGIGYPDGRVELINNAFEELTGYSAEELQRIGWGTAVLTPPEWHEIEREKLAELQRTGIPVRYEKEYIRKNGTRVPIELLVHLMTDSEGKPQFYYSFVNDITERKLAAEAVRASEAFVRAVLNSLPEHVVVLDNQGVVSAVNEPWEHFALENGGAPCDVSVGANYLDVCRRSSAAGDPEAHKAIEGLEALFAGERQKFMMEYPCPTPSGELWFLMHATRITQGLQGVIVTHVDITELKRTSLALRETQTRLALVIEAVKAGYWDWDLNTNKVYLSPEWQRQIGFDENESLNQWEDWEGRLHPDDRTFVLEATENYIAGRQPVHELEFRLRHKDGSYRWIHSRGGLLHDQNNHPYRMMGIDLDITGYKKTKELNERRDQMEQAFRLYVAGQTVAAIAHELNQPLAAISSYADVALHMLLTDNRNQEKLAHVLENCALQAQRAGDVIRQLMTVLHKGETIREPVYLSNSIDVALDIVKADRDLSAFKIELNLTAGLPQVSANSLQIQKVLLNLLCNGLESMRERGIKAGTMTITTRCSADDPAMAQVTVCDSGKGVADTADLKTMFQPFHTTKPSGLGMGLAISRALIEAHGGKMWAEQNADIGISIHFTLPFDK